jgi:hypothetical protein
MKFTLFIIVFIQIITSCNIQNDTVEDLNNFHENRIFKIDNEVLIEKLKEYVAYHIKDSNKNYVLMIQVRSNGDTIEYSIDYPRSIHSIICCPPDMTTYVDNILILIYSAIHNDIVFTDEYAISSAKIAFPKQFEKLEKKEDIFYTMSTELSDLRLVFVSGVLINSKAKCGPIFRLKHRKFPDRYVDPVSVDIAIERIVYTLNS